MHCQGKVVVITGATGALGTSVTRTFLGAEATVVALGSREPSLERLRADLRPGEKEFTGFVADVTDESSIESAVKKIHDQFGKIDVLLNLAGGFLGGVQIAETTEAQWDKMMTLNLKSVFLFCKHVIPLMVERKSGRIITVGGKGGLAAISGMAAYSASKAGLINLTQGIAAEIRDQGVTANVVVPGIIDTPDNRRAMPNADFSKWVAPESLANIILFLCSDAAKDVNGAVVPVYGNS